MGPTDLDLALRGLAARQYGLVTVRQAYEAGANQAAVRHLVDSGRWNRLTYGVLRQPGAPRSPEQRLMLLLLLTGPRAVASHGTAAALWGISGFDLGQLEVTTPQRTTRRQLRPGTIRSTGVLPGDHVTTTRWLRTTTPARTIADLASAVPPGRAERALDSALAMGLTTVPKLWAVHDELASRGRGGLRLLRSLLAVRGDGYVAPESEIEARLLAVLRAGGLPLPTRQRRLGDVHGAVGRVDFLYPDAKLVIETDGRRHHTALLDRRADANRDNRLMAEGARVLRFDWRDVTSEPDKVVRLVRAALAAARRAGPAQQAG